MSKNKLLHISLGSHNQGMWKAFDNAFETIHIDWTVYEKDLATLNQEVYRIFNEFEPDIVFMQLQVGGIIDPSILKYMTEKSITINWTGDVRHPIPKWYIDFGRDVDVTLFSNMNDVESFLSMGINADYLQVGFDEEIFTPEGTKNAHPSIVFLGTNYLETANFPLSALRHQMVRTLRKRYGINFMAYGNNWKKEGCGSHFLHIPQEAEVYRSTKIAINLSHFDYGRYSSDRMLRMMGSGAFCLSHHFKDIEKDYEVGKHVATWNNIDSLIRQIDYYIANPVERELIRKEGCKMVRENYTWNNVMDELKKVIGI